MPPHSLKIFEIQRYYRNEPGFNGVFSRDNSPKTVKYGTYVISLDEYPDVKTHWIALYVRTLTLFIFTVLEFNMFLNRLKYLLDIKIWKQTYLEYNQKIQ